MKTDAYTECRGASHIAINDNTARGASHDKGGHWQLLPDNNDKEPC
jgi:hypothetical protein